MHRDAGLPNWKYICIRFQCWSQVSWCIYLIPKRPAEDQIERYKITKDHGWPDRWTDILWSHSGDLNPWSTAEYDAQNSGPRKWTSIANLNMFLKQKLWYNFYIFENLFILRSFIKKNRLNVYITLVDSNSMGHTNDFQKSTRTIPCTDGYIRSTRPHWVPLVPCLG